MVVFFSVQRLQDDICAGKFKVTEVSSRIAGLKAIIDV